MLLLLLEELLLLLVFLPVAAVATVVVVVASFSSDVVSTAAIAFPVDDTLVSLSEPSGHPPSTYINASLVRDFVDDGDTFIATQGPKRNTVVDFWNMVLEQRTTTVVCLTNVVEAGRVGFSNLICFIKKIRMPICVIFFKKNQVKCFQYWPNEGELLHFDDLSLFTRQEVETSGGECVIRKIELSKVRLR